jgi:hypothetical protein
MGSSGPGRPGTHLLAACAASSLLALTTAAAAGGPVARQHATSQVIYRGYTFRVPAGWPVIRLDGHASTCVRFDRHAVYLGAPAAGQACPAAAVGATAALLVQPAAPGGRARAVDNPVARRISVSAPLITVTASYGAGRRSRSLIRAILASASLPAPLTQRPARPAEVTFGPAALHAWASSYTGRAFDTCAAPSSQAMTAWREFSRFQGIGIYIGGGDRACAQPNLTAAWVRQQAAAGWRFIPLYVGPQLSFGEVTSPVTQAASAARDAAAQAARLGLGPGTPLYYDMEAYPPRDTARALSFFTAWTRALHAEGYRSGIYSSSLSGVRDLARNVTNPAYAMPDVIYDAWWNGAADTADPVIPPGAWTGHRRVHQYSGSVIRRFGGFTISIDRDYMDVQLAARSSRRAG